ncbi:larval cuticle protein A2B-like isoform X2 [Atheta coriaria]|uniref:larval cuticle protein A2B-like isoform X2 n=1 Tax=Dalotia coriaria TaxID=877792 RepID=UPI0031F3DC5C
MFHLRNTVTIIFIITIGLNQLLSVGCRTNNVDDYSYSYSIQKPEYGIVTHHWEKRHGSVVTGGYSMLDPNGKVRVVEYHVDGGHGFKAFVQYRRPPAGNDLGHLRFPYHYRTPIRLAEPVSLITPDLFRPKEFYPNLPSERN